MKMFVKYVLWILEFDDGNQVEIEMFSNGKEVFSIKPLSQPIGLVFYL